MIKRLLIPLDPSGYTDTAIDFSLKLAKHHKIELTGLVILDLPGIEKSIGIFPYGAIHYSEKLGADKEKIAQEHIEELINKFKDKCESAGADYNTAYLQGSPSERILAESIYYDAVVMGLRTFFIFETQDKPGDSLAKLLDHSVTPIYALPKNYKFLDLRNQKIKILLTIDEPLSSARAIQKFVQVGIPELTEIDLVIRADDKISAEFQMNETENYLKSHGYSLNNKEWTVNKLSDLIDEKYIGKIDIIVIGNDTKKGLFTSSANDLTNSMIKLNRVPLLIG